MRCIPLAVLLTSIAQAQPPAAALDKESFRISMDVDWVMLQASVHDRGGHRVAKLRQQDFDVFEDGKPQQIRLFRQEDTPVTVGLVIDHSGSMREKLAEVTVAARAFVHSSNANDQMFVVNFNEHVSSGLPVGMHFSDSAEQLGDAIWSEQARGTTALYDAVIDSLERLRKGTSDKKVLLIISDGGDNASKARLEQVLKMTEQSNATIYAIGIFGADDSDKNPRVLSRVARESGGEAFFPHRLEETVQICQRIARDIREQYTIGYVSPKNRDGEYHKVRLAARPQGGERVSVRTRAGYSTAAK
ncbi:MAG TPA: VWA domain-containing protein [Bryobacteraceae bacterium]|jgi:Ca-activated chloride channel family protein|nr:VWA domain-containing protein [Bryobacteraceae bacterium]